MLSLIFGNPPRLRELAVRVALYGHRKEENLPVKLPKLPPLIVLHVSSSSTVQDVFDRINGKYSLVYDCSLLFLGKVLSRESKIPEDCFENYTEVDEDAESFRSRLVLCVDVSVLSQKRNEPGKNDKLPTHNEQINEQSIHQEGDDSEWQADRKLLVEEHFDATRTKSTFDILKELEQIGCGQFYDELVKGGFSSEGAFACLQNSDFEENRLWIPMRARTRILALSDSIRSKLCYGSNSDMKHNGNNANRIKIIPPEIRGKMATASRQVEESENFDFTYSNIEKDRVESKCCDKHHNIVVKRKADLIKMGAQRFDAQVTAIFSWIPDQCEDLALFDNMFDGVLRIINNRGWADIDSVQFKVHMLTSSAVNRKELNIREFCSLQSLSTIPQTIYFSKSKFIEVAKGYILSHNPNFFLSYHC